MTENARPRADAADSTTAEKRQLPATGTVLANYIYSPSYPLDQPSKGQRGTWGGARNRADRLSCNLTHKQVASLIDAANEAFATGRVFQRHWTIHYGLAGVAPCDGACFIGKVLDLVGKQARRDGGEMAAIWVRECASGKGEHVHILMHLPKGMSLRNRTRRWIVASGANYRTGVSKVTRIRGTTSESGLSSRQRNLDNAANVLRYMLKGAKEATFVGSAPNLSGHGGLIVGKRCGRTVNLGPRQWQSLNAGRKI